ncbi:hypothetical protein HKX48_004934 [Thoreauomyces humboldtii]|nr:hypothetical protein HKX48_004934 [Thoreauomyces humboldtii]
MPSATEHSPLLRDSGGRSAHNRSESANESAPQDSPEYRKCRKLVLVLLVLAYTGYYFCKTTLPLALPTLESEGLSRANVSAILTSGYVFYLGGKFLSGFCVDKFGGKATLLAGLVGSIATTIAFPLLSNPIWFAAVRGISQLFSSVGWGACVKIVRGWYPPSRAAHAVAIASLAETLGDALVRVTLGSALMGGLSWQAMFYVASGVASCILVPSCFVPGAPDQKGFEKPVEKDEGAKEDMKSRSIYLHEDSDGLLPIIKNVRVWLLAAQLLVVILIRESFASFVSSLIASELNLDTGKASVASAIFPAMGAISSIAGGWLLDRVSQNRRGLIPFASLTFLTVAMLGMWAVTPQDAGGETSASLKVLVEGGGDTKQIIFFLSMIGLIALFLFAPKVIIDGAFVMDLAGGPEKVGTVTAFVTGVGYLGGCISPTVTGLLADAKGWPIAILLMAGLAGLTTVAAAAYWFLDLRALKSADNRDEEED